MYIVYINFPKTLSSAPHYKAFEIQKRNKEHFSWSQYFIETNLLLKGTNVSQYANKYASFFKYMKSRWPSPL